MSTNRFGTDRRKFLKSAALTGVAAAASATTLAAPDSVAATHVGEGLRSPGPINANTELTPRSDALTQDTCGADYMVDVMRGLGIEYFAATPGNTFLGLHEAVVNYGMVTNPRLTFLTNVHEEASIAMAHGYAKIEGKPMACGVHTVVGLQHASMAIYNAWADRVPVFIVVGASLDAARRRPGVDWDHSAQDGNAMVRDYTKWDDQPGSLRAWGESATRAFKFAMTPPYGPVLLATDTLMQEEPLPGGRPPPIPRMPAISPPIADTGAIEETAKLLVAAEMPVLYADRLARTPAGVAHLVELAELLQAPVIDSGNRFNFPWRHPLNQTQRTRGMVAGADLLLELEPGDPFSVSTFRTPDGTAKSFMKEGSKRVTISSVDLYMKANYQAFQRFAGDIDMAMAADAEATMPSLIEAVRRAIPESLRSALADRGARLARSHEADLADSRQAATNGWDAQPISTARLCAELYNQLRLEDWSLASFTEFQSRWPQRLWDADKHYRYIGGSGGYGIGYLGPATFGAALANHKHGRITVAINGDGDTMFGPGILWTAAHERIPMLYIVHNNRGYHMEIMQMQVIANRRQRGEDRTYIGNALNDPPIDFATVARGMGVYAQGPIDNPADLGPAIRRALAVVKKGEPALIDVVSQGR
jgi:acetolactate synthase-1/2/3 large subunit